MTLTPHSLSPRATDRPPATDLGSFEVVRRLPVTTWSLRPSMRVPDLEPCPTAAHAMLALGRLSGWIDAIEWRASAKARASLRHALPQPMPALRSTQAWLGMTSEGATGIAHVPAPPAWLPTLFTQWQRAVADAQAGARSDGQRMHMGLCSASWTIWLFTLVQPYGDASSAAAAASAATLVSDVAATAVPMVAGVPTGSEAHAEQRRLLAGALDLEGFARWHRFWLGQLVDETQQLHALLLRMDAARRQLLEAAEAMRAPRSCVLLAHTLVERPQISVGEAALVLDITFRAAQAIIEKFASQGLLREVTGRRRDRVFSCDALSDPMLPWSQQPRPR